MSRQLYGRTDAISPDTVLGLRRAGFRVQVTSGVGNGFPDLLIGTPWNSLALLELKDEETGRVRMSQGVWHSEWRRFPVFVAVGAEDAIRQMVAAHEL